jgi:hypothetical protein
MNGSEWIQLVEIYVEAINEGAVPSIQSAWTYICKQGAESAYESARARFEEELAQFVTPQTLPMNQEDLESFFREQVAVQSQEVAKNVKGEADIVLEC